MPAVDTADGDRVPTGKADYVLLDQRSRPLAVIEAKRSAIQPYIAKKQALPYARNIGAPFIFLTNGELIYFWDYTNDDARIINSFFSRRDLERMVHMRKNVATLATIKIPTNYLRNGEPLGLLDPCPLCSCYEKKVFKAALNYFFAEYIPQLGGDLTRGPVVNKICQMVEEFFPSTESIRY